MATMKGIIGTLLTAAVVAAGCSGAAPQKQGPGLTRLTQPRPATASTVGSISEDQPVVSMAYLAGYLYAATPRQILRYNVRTGKLARITGAQGLPGKRVLAVAAHKVSGLWVATDKGLAQYRGGGWGSHGHHRPPGQQVRAMAASERGVWIGGPGGLAHFGNGGWRGLLQRTSVTALAADGAGTGVWIGTDGQGVLQHQTGGKLRRHGPKRGQRVLQVRSLALTPEGEVVVAGRGADGDRVDLFDGKHWISYLARPGGGEVRWVMPAGDDLLMVRGARVLRLQRGSAAHGAGQGHGLRSGQAGPGAPWGYKVPRFTARALARWLPQDPTTLLGHHGHVLIGSRALGVALYSGDQLQWFRAQSLLGRRERLRMACVDDQCYIAGRGGRGLRTRGGSLGLKPLPRDPRRVHGALKFQAFVRDQWGRIVALSSASKGRRLQVDLRQGARFVPVYQARLRLPAGKRAAVRFVRQDSTGRLWVGLWAVDARGHRQPWGMVVMRPPPSHQVQSLTADPAPASEAAAAAATVPLEQPSFFHRSTLLPGEQRPARSLAVPDDVRDIWFAGQKIWLATGDGVCLIQGTEVGTEVKLTTENEGLRSELIYGFARSPSGDLLVASFAGVGRKRGRQWRFDMGRSLRGSTRVLLTAGKTLWAGTTRGLLRVRKGGRVKRIDQSAGLADDMVLDLHLERGKRLWVLTEGGLSVVPLRR